MLEYLDAFLEVEYVYDFHHVIDAILCLYVVRHMPYLLESQFIHEFVLGLEDDYQLSSKERGT